MSFMSPVLTPNEHCANIYPNFSIGIDPGQHTGFAIYSIQQRKIVELRTVDFWGAYSQVCAFQPIEISRVVVEVPDTKHVWQQMPKGTKAIQRQAVNVGGVIREAQLLAEGLMRAGYKVVRVNPRGKRTHAEFCKFTGWTGKTNQHCRDAALLCWGR